MRYVVHCRKAKYDIYIGRPSPWGNPFVIGKDGSCAQVIAKYWAWLQTRPDLMQQQIAGNFKQEVPKKENPRDQPKLLAANRQLFVHRQRRKSDVDPVEKGNDVKEKYEGNNSHPQLLNRSRFSGHSGSNCFVRHDHLNVCLLDQKDFSAGVAGPGRAEIAETVWRDCSSRQGTPPLDSGLVFGCPVIRPGSMPGAEITSYKPTSGY